MKERTAWPPGHVVHMSIENFEKLSLSVARCDCGWDHRVKWPVSARDQAAQNSAIERHWRQAEAAR